MDNYAIADNFSLLSKLMDIHGENSFKSKTYSVAAFTIEKLPMQLADTPADKIASIKGIGESVSKKILEQLKTGELGLLSEYIANTPPGIIEMLGIKGIGPKKIAVIWKELEIETPGELLYACNENRLLLYKGFGEKTQENIKEAIKFYLSSQDRHLYGDIEAFALSADAKIKTLFSQDAFLLAGEFRRQMEIIDRLEWVTTASAGELKLFFESSGYAVLKQEETVSSLKGTENVEFMFYHSNSVYRDLFVKSASGEFLEEWLSLYPLKDFYNSEEEIFTEAGLQFIPAFLREKKNIIHKAKLNNLTAVIQPSDITAIIHSHSKWSDGVNTIEEMAKAAIQNGLQYLVISDHSKTAFYANGLKEEQVVAQHQQVEELNTILYPFKIFKSIESDILNDGNLDYSKEVLHSFDVVIASVHSNLKMKEEKAMMRLLAAIENPYTSILGHATGRLLLSRNGYPVDHKKIIDACAANNVVIELNAHPKRLDMDWRWIDYCLEKSVLISIDPDAHSIEGFKDTRYGVLAAQKAGVTKEQNLSSYSLGEFEKFVAEQKLKRG
jgi:DNA polymerase (family 10)